MQLSKRTTKIRNGMLSALFAFTMLLFTPMSNAIAADADSMRIGGTYKFLTLGTGARFQDCQRSCDDDVSCKAWTFIKERTRRRKGINFNLGPDLNIGFGGKREVIPAQCRLKHSVGAKHDNECCTSGVKRVAQRRSSRKAERCADYAEKAIEQQDSNLSKRCRYRGNRWDQNYRNHYRWCMDSSTRRSNQETNVRAEKLRECGKDRRVRDRRCDRYASTALDILQQADKNDCRANTREWDNEHERIYDWCLDKGRAKRRQVLDNAQSKLASCIRRGGGARVERCETYADDALEQVSRAQKNDCRTSGTTWARDFKTHYQVCRKSNRRSRTRKTQARRDFINRCIRRGSQARVLETGSVEVRQRNTRQWHSVRFNKRFKDPVVIMGPVSFNGGDPAHARVRRVTSRGFEFRIEEFGKDGKHTRETLSYMIIEKGIHRFEGSVIEAGTILTGADLVDRNWSRVRLSNRWRSAPVVLAQTQTFKGRDSVNARIKGVTRSGFEVTLSEQESDRQGHAREIVAYVAISEGRHNLEGEQDGNTGIWAGSVSRTKDKWRDVGYPRRYFGSVPGVFAMAQSSNGADTFDIRYRSSSRRSVEMRLQEEQSKDRETRHTNEVLGVVALPFGSYWAQSSSSVDDQVADDPARSPEQPVVSGGGLNNCLDYAQRAVGQFRRSRRLSCSFSGRTWHAKERQHVRWCRRNGLGAASDQLTDHHDRLHKCQRRADEHPAVVAPPEAAHVDWRAIKGRLKHVSVGADGTVWGVSKDGKVWQRRRGKWKKQRGRLKQLDVGTRGVIWGVGNNNHIFRWSGRSWKKVPGLLKQISVGADGSVWGVSPNNSIFAWNGRSWTKARGKLTQISVGKGASIWGVANNVVYRFARRRWIRMPGTMKQVSVSSNGDIYGVTPDNMIGQWSPSQNKWMMLNGSLKQISVGDGSQLWGVNRRDKIYSARIR